MSELSKSSNHHFVFTGLAPIAKGLAVASTLSAALSLSHPRSKWLARSTHVLSGANVVVASIAWYFGEGVYEFRRRVHVGAAGAVSAASLSAVRLRRVNR